MVQTSQIKALIFTLGQTRKLVKLEVLGGPSMMKQLHWALFHADMECFRA
jgi:hypothetical protein